METQDYCSSSRFNIQMEKIVVKLGTDPVPTLLWEGGNTTCFSQWELFLLLCPCQEHPATTPLTTAKTSLEYIGLHTTLCLTPPPTLACLFVWELML